MAASARSHQPTASAGGPTAPPAGFELDVTLLEVADPAGLVSITDDNCGSTCGACTTGVA